VLRYAPGANPNGSLNDIAVTPGRTYRVSATIDARYTSGSWPCFYLGYPVGYPEGPPLGMTCAPSGKLTTPSVIVRMPPNTTAVRFIAFTNGATVQDKKLIAYINPAVVEIASAGQKP